MGSSHTIPVLRSASFSEYLDLEVEDCACSPANSVPQNELRTPATPGRISPGDHEADVFDAKECFNTNSYTQATRDKRENHIPARKPGARGAISESRSGIGNPFTGSDCADIPHQKKKNCRTRWKGILSRFGCSGQCSDSKSVQVSEESQAKKPGPDQILRKNPIGESVSGPDRTGEFEFPVLNAEELAEEKPRKSLDVFGSSAKDIVGGDAVAINLQRKLSILTWDAIPEARSLPVPLRTDSTHVEDVDSCTSSDLFEIESISAICRDVRSRTARSEGPPEKVQGIQKRSGSSRFPLSGCKSQKSVNVTEPGKEKTPR